MEEHGSDSHRLYTPATNTFVASILNFRCCQRLSRVSLGNILEKLGNVCTMKELKQRFLISGSNGEGVVMSNDVDYMLIDTSLKVNEGGNIGDLTALMDQTKPGFAKLFVTNPEYFPLKDCARLVDGKYYLSSLLYIQKQVQNVSELSDAEGVHGPAVLRARASILHVPSDNVYTLKSPRWPGKVLEDFKSRVLHTWLTNEMVSHIEECGCFFVPIGHPLSSDKDLEWRLSFSLTENYLIKSLLKVQYNCYNFLKLLGNRFHSFKDDKLLCSYYFKTALLWTIEKEAANLWVESDILTCIGSVLARMSMFYKEHNFPNYFVPGNNMIEHLPAEKCTQLAEEFTNVRKDLLYNVFCSLQVGVKIKQECKAFLERLNLEDFEEQLSNTEKRDQFYRNVIDALEALNSLELQDLMEAGSKGISSSSELYRQKYRRDIRNDLQNFLDPNLFDFLSREYTFETKKDALISVVRNIALIVIEPRLSLCYRQTLYRALGNLCHIEALYSADLNERAKLVEAAEDYYTKGVELVFPDGFDDMMLSGKVHLAQFHYMNKNLLKTAEILHEVETLLDNHKLALEISDACICTEICVPVHLEALKHDKGLFEYFCTLSSRESKFINSVALAHYLKLKCYQQFISEKEATGPVSHFQTEFCQKTNPKERDVCGDEKEFRTTTYQELLERFEEFCAFYDKIPSFTLIDYVIKDTSKLLLQIVKK